MLSPRRESNSRCWFCRPEPCHLATRTNSRAAKERSLYQTQRNNQLSLHTLPCPFNNLTAPYLFQHMVDKIFSVPMLLCAKIAKIIKTHNFLTQKKLPSSHILLICPTRIENAFLFRLYPRLRLRGGNISLWIIHANTSDV